MNKFFNNLCTPAKIYFLIAILCLVYGFFNHFSLVLLSVNLFFSIVWTMVLSCLCDKGFSSFSWFLLLFPYILIFIVMFNNIRTFEGMTLESSRKPKPAKA
jgi:hypothetical protein